LYLFQVSTLEVKFNPLTLALPGWSPRIHSSPQVRIRHERISLSCPRGRGNEVKLIAGCAPHHSGALTSFTKTQWLSLEARLVSTACREKKNVYEQASQKLADTSNDC
jgi:hypothetical protein